MCVWCGEKDYLGRETWFTLPFPFPHSDVNKRMKHAFIIHRKILGVVRYGNGRTNFMSSAEFVRFCWSSFRWTAMRGKKIFHRTLRKIPTVLFNMFKAIFAAPLLRSVSVWLNFYRFSRGLSALHIPELFTPLVQFSGFGFRVCFAKVLIKNGFERSVFLHFTKWTSWIALASLQLLSVINNPWNTFVPSTTKVPLGLLIAINFHLIDTYLFVSLFFLSLEALLIHFWGRSPLVTSHALQ